MSGVLVVGATSAIAEQCARLWAARGDRLFLVGRDAQQLEAIAADLRVRGSPSVGTLRMDANDFDAHVPMLERAEAELGTVDTVLIAHGTLSDQAACERDVALAMREIRTNALSHLALMTEVANRFEARRSGTIAVISSVAGDRGRQSNYVYGSAKAMVTAFASGLRQRLAKAGVAVVTIKPGFVDTPMTAAFPKGPLWAKPAAVAAAIVAACDRRRDEVYVPWFWLPIMAIVRSVPTAIFKRIRL